MAQRLGGLLLQRTRVQFLAPLYGASQQSVTSAAGNLTSKGTRHVRGAQTHMQAQVRVGRRSSCHAGDTVPGFDLQKPLFTSLFKGTESGVE